MFANLFTPLALSVILRLVRSETSKETLQDVIPKTTLKPNLDYVSRPVMWDVDPNLKPLWVFRQSKQQSDNKQENEFHRVVLKEPLSVTRLAKSLAFGFDPYFNKGYFHPFERRQRPVTLVAFRKNGLLPRRSIKIDDIKSAEVAEMQSPFNEISAFWDQEPGTNN